MTGAIVKPFTTHLYESSLTQFLVWRRPFTLLNGSFPSVINPFPIARSNRGSTRDATFPIRASGSRRLLNTGARITHMWDFVWRRFEASE